MRTVHEALRAFAADSGTTVEVLIEARLAELVARDVPARYRAILSEVWLRLPEGWDSHAHWELVAGAIDDPGVGNEYLAGARLLKHEIDALQHWEVRIDPTQLAPFSDAAVRWIVAHELAHVASALPTDRMIRDGELSEDRADHFALVWGFGEEHAAFERERRQSFHA